MDWIRKNGWAIILVAASVVSNYSISGYRIAALEKHVLDTDQSIATLNSGSVITQVALAQIQTKLEYITIQINKIVP